MREVRNVTENELYHYGIKGMKWGIRRTEAQLARARGERASSSSGSTPAAKKSSSKSSSSGKKKVSEMSDDELSRAVRRLQLEQQYRQMNPEKVSAGRRFVNRVMKDVVIPAATTTARNTLQTIMKRELDKALRFDTGNNYDRDKKKDK